MRGVLVYECRTCGRVWVGDQSVAQMQAVMERARSHVGGCVDDEPDTWSTRCGAEPWMVKPWPALEAAYRLGGVEAAEEVRRPAPDRNAVFTRALRK